MFCREVDSEIKLALVQKSFAPRYAELVKDNFDYLEMWLAWPPHCKNRADFEEFIQGALRGYAEGKSMVCGILYNEELVGNVSFNTINHDLGKAEIGYWLAEPFQGRGIMTRVCQKMMSIAFDELELAKVEISAAVENTSSRSVCERLGMNLEGIITRSENLNGRIIDHAVYGIHRNEYEGTKSATDK